MVEHLPLTQARNSLSAVVKRVHLGKTYVILEKDGIPLAGLMDIDEFEDDLELQDPKVHAHIRKNTEEYRTGKSRSSVSPLPARWRRSDTDTQVRRVRAIPTPDRHADRPAPSGSRRVSNSRAG